MKFTQFKFLNNGLDKSINIPLSFNINTVGEQDALDSYINQATNSSINESNDIEKFKFKNYDNINISFNYSGNTSYVTNYTSIGFTDDDIIFNRSSYKNSFYIIDLYDSYNSNIQNKITTNYFTILGNLNSTVYNVSPTTNNKQLANIYIPKNVINNITGNTITYYIRFSFYNAKLGKLHLFYNSENVNLLTDEKYYYKVNIDISNKSFNFNTNIANLTPLEVVNNNYIDKFNRSIDILPQKQQNFPSGNTFNYVDQKYFDQ